MISIDDLFQYYSEYPATYQIERSPIFIQYRSQNEGIITQKVEIERIKRMTQNPKEKWFIPHFIKILSKVPDSLFEPLMYLSIEMKMSGISFFFSFRNALVNLFGFIRIERFLQQVFAEIKTVSVREAIVGLFLEFEPKEPLEHKILPGGYVRVNAIEKWIWNESALEETYDDNPDSIEEYISEITPLIQSRLELLLNAFLEPKEKRGSIRLVLVPELPGNPSQYPSHLQVLAELVFAEYEKDKVIYGTKFRGVSRWREEIHTLRR
jgi:hypothetical protein